jgi:hypothetical protein
MTEQPREACDGKIDDNKSHPFQIIFNSLRSITSYQDVLQHPSSSGQISSAIAQMNKVTLQHLGIDETYVNNLSFGQCMTVVESENFDIAVFLLPRGFVLQLHDHPNMVVCSKLIFGSLSIRSFTKIKSEDGGDILAKLELNAEKTCRDDPWFLTPRDGNFHEITPLSDCVMLDILLPPYDDHDRQCNFYSAHKTDSEQQWLLKLLPPHLQEQVRLPHMIQYRSYRPS